MFGFARTNPAPPSSHRTRLGVEPLEDRFVPTWFMVRMISPYAGYEGQTASTYAGGGLQTDPALELEEPGYAYIDAPSAGEAVRQAVTGTVQMFVPPPTGVGYTERSFTFSAGSVGFAASDHKPFLLQPGPALPLGAPPPTPGADLWGIYLEDLSFDPTYCDWDYNDWRWVAEVLDMESDGGGGGGGGGLPGGGGSTAGTFAFESTPDDPTNSAGFLPVQNLRVSKWPNAFQVDVADKTVSAKPLGSWIYQDVDDFTVRYTQSEADRTTPAKNNPAAVDTINADMKVAIRNGAGDREPVRSITLTETGNNTGVFRSRSFILVSNAPDDEWDVTGTNCLNCDNTADDPTLLAALTDYVNVRLSNATATDPWASAFVKPRASITLRLYILRPADEGVVINPPPYVPVADVEEQVQAIREGYAQFGILVHLEKRVADSVVEEPRWFEGGQFHSFDGGAPFDVSVADQRAHDLFDRLRDAKSGLIHVYYLNRLVKTLPGDDVINGRAYTDTGTDAASLAFMDSVVIGKDSDGLTSIRTLAHEVGHILGLNHAPGEVGGPRDSGNPNLSDVDRITHQTNVMAPVGFEDSFPYADTDSNSVVDQKRFTTSQQDTIYSHQRPQGKPRLLKTP